MPQEQSRESIHHKFWIASSNFFETSLIFYPIYNAAFLKDQQNRALTLSAKMQVFDCEGVPVNSLECSFDPNKTSVIETAPLIESLKYEAGIKHGMIEVITSPNLSVQCRINSANNAAVLGDLLEISKYQKAFLPLRLGADTNTFIVVANLSKETNNIKSKIFLGKRSPELSTELLPGAVRIISMANEFAECIDAKTYSSLGYLRVSSRNDLPFALQIIEAVEGKKDELIFNSIL